jgi:trehalose/maltose hydrolase-like predicted phosphorylase
MGNAARGLHLATMGSLWQAAVMGFGGVRRRGEALGVDPHLPAPWKRLRVPLRFRGARVLLDIRRTRLGINVEEARLHLVLGRRRLVLSPGEHRFVRGPRGGWKESKR